MGVFSTNEKIEEINTPDIKYMLLPYYLGQLQLKMCSRERKEVVEIAEIYFKDFLQRCADYELCEPYVESQPVEDDQVPKTEVERLTQMAQQRDLKLKAYRTKKELDEQIKEIREMIEREHVDEDVKRDFYLKQIKSSITDATDELISIKSEKEILEHLKLIKHGKCYTVLKLYKSLIQICNVNNRK